MDKIDFKKIFKESIRIYFLPLTAIYTAMKAEFNRVDDECKASKRKNE
jgi:hypothetical protein